MRTYVTTLLETNGFKPLAAEDGEAGLAVARDERPSLIILDVMMPKMGGIMMFHELKKDQDLRDIPVIMLSAISRKSFFHSHKFLGGQSKSREAIDQPATYIEKPPEPDQLLEAIHGCLKASK